MSGTPDHPDTLAAVYLRDRDVPCPGCGYNRRNGTAARCPECGHSLTLGPTMPNHVFCREATLTLIAYSLLVCSIASTLYFAVTFASVCGFPPRPFRSTLEFGVTVFVLACVTTIILAAAQILRWRTQRTSPRRPTGLLRIAALIFHGTWALFLILLWIAGV